MSSNDGTDARDRWPNVAWVRRGLGCVLVLCLAGAGGCGNGLATVTGNITMNGEPLATGSDITGRVFLYPEGGTGVPAVGMIDEQGNYRVRTGSQAGVKPGAYTVTISASRLIPSRIEGAPPGAKRLTDRRFADPSRSGLRVEVAAGSNAFDFEVDPEPRRQARRGR